MADIAWTESQQQAIGATGQDILVTAGAGSGKTSVLAARCAHLVADGRSPCPIDRLLVVTFTDAAATEMRNRIADALRDRRAQSSRQAWLQRQLALIDFASISTLHGFCRKTLRRYFAHANIDPEAPMLDAREATLLRRQAAQEVCDEMAARDDATGERILHLLDDYGGQNDNRLIDAVLSLNAYLASLPDPDQWINDCLAHNRIDRPGELPAYWFDRLCAALRDELQDQQGIVVQHLQQLAALHEVTRPIVGLLDAYGQLLTDWLATLGESPSASKIDTLAQGIEAFSPRRNPSINDKIKAQGDDVVATFRAAQGRWNEVKELFKKRLQQRFGGFITADWAEGIARIQPHVEMIFAFARAAAERYARRKHELGVLDFNDLERKTLDMLRDEDNGVARRLRDRFDHVLVDEYQDTNRVQSAILHCVSRDGSDGRPPNLFTVGDVKQCIYRFRLAEPELFRRREDDFARTDTRGMLIRLRENFRSREPIIDGINALFERLMTRDLGGTDYNADARLVHGRSETDALPGPAIELHVLEERKAAPPGNAHDDADAADDAEALDWEQIEREAYLVAQRIRDLYEQGTDYGDIVILFRSLKQRGSMFVRQLHRCGIPAVADVAGGFFDALEVLDLLSLLSLLDNAQQDIPLAAFLRAPMFGEPFTAGELTGIRAAAPRHARFHEAVRTYAESSPTEALQQRLRDRLDRLAAWRSVAARRPVAEVLWRIYEDCGALAYVAGLRSGRQARANLLQLHEYARQFSTFHRQGLYRFLKFIEELQQRDQELEPGTPPNVTDDVVRIMTIHASKGLDFPVVFLGEVGKLFNLSDSRASILFDRSLGLALRAVDRRRRITYPTLPQRLVADATREAALAEEMRLLYVALTRAEDRIILVGTGSLSRLDERREQAVEKTGPLPLLERRTARRQLDWLFDAIIAQPTDRVHWSTDAGDPTDAHLFSVHLHDEHKILGWQLDPPQSTDAAARFKTCAQFLPLDRVAARAPEPPLDHAAGAMLHRVQHRLTTPYQAAALAHVPAVVAASALKQRWDTRQDATDPAQTWLGSATQPTSTSHLYRLPEPRAFSQDATPAPTRLGTATHLYLEHLDMTGRCDVADLQHQRDALMSAQVLSPDDAAAIDLSAIAWFLTTELAARLRNPATTAHREWPFVTGIDPVRYDRNARARDRRDVMLVRGMIDLLFDAGSGWEIADYKTDRLAPDEVQARADWYRGQLDVYALAAGRAFGSITRRWLVFLDARQIVEV